MIDELSEDLMFRLEVFQFLLQVQKFFFRHLVISAVLPSLHDRFATLKKLKKLRINAANVVVVADFHQVATFLEA